jgi:hypothetical protein
MLGGLDVSCALWIFMADDTDSDDEDYTGRTWHDNSEYPFQVQVSRIWNHWTISRDRTSAGDFAIEVLSILQSST